MTEKSVMTVYCCGGLGINLGVKLRDYARKASVVPGYATIRVAMADTSDSNMRTEDFAENEVYLIKGRDGSGGIRAENHKEIAECIADILHQHPPGDVSIVLSSLSGGTGSVIAPSLASELLAQGKDVIVFSVASFESLNEMKNNVKSMQSYENISSKHKRPLAMYYLENNQKTNRATNDEFIYNSVLSLSILFSGQNIELDGSDLHNWLNYQRVTSYPTKLMYLTFTDDNVSAEKSSVVSVATLAEKGSNEGTVDTPEYRCIGYIPEKFDTDDAGVRRIKTPFHYVILDGVIASIYAEHKNRLKEYDETARAKRRHIGSIIDDVEVGETDNGIVL